MGLKVSERLNAQYIAVARSGIGIYRNYGGPVEGSIDCLPNMYDYTLYGDTTEIWDFSRYIPDIVCVNLGTNDCVLEGYSMHRLKDAFVKFSQKIRSNYPDARIIWMTGCMLHGKPLEDLQVTCACIDLILPLRQESWVMVPDGIPVSGSMNVWQMS